MELTNKQINTCIDKIIFELNTDFDVPIFNTIQGKYNFNIELFNISAAKALNLGFIKEVSLGYSLTPEGHKMAEFGGYSNYISKENSWFFRNNNENLKWFLGQIILPIITGSIGFFFGWLTYKCK